MLAFVLVALLSWAVRGAAFFVCRFVVANVFDLKLHGDAYNFQKLLLGDVGVGSF